MPSKYSKLNTKGQVFACTTTTKEECFKNQLFGSNRAYAPAAMRVKKNDYLFLFDLDDDLLYGVFKAVSDASINIKTDAWKGRYPYQVKVKGIGKITAIDNAKKLLDKLGISRSSPITKKSLVKLLDIYRSEDCSLEKWFDQLSEEKNLKKIEMPEKSKSWNLLNDFKKIEVKSGEQLPLLEATTLWNFPRQSYGETPKGNNKYAGVTPALLIWNLVWRYTEPGDLVVDPMCGSGTTIDVCKEEGRKVIGYDIHPVREDIIQNDARKIPLSDNTVDLVFIDSPYGDNIRYNDNPKSIGKISSEKEEFYDALEEVIKESHRILKPGKTLGWLIGDQWVKKKFTPVGFNLFERLTKYFETRDIICIARRGQSSNTGLWHNRARRFNFFLRGFKYLFIMQKPLDNSQTPQKPRNIKWNHYER